MKSEVLEPTLYLEWSEGDLEQFLLVNTRPLYECKALDIRIAGHEDGTWGAHWQGFREMGRSPQIALNELCETLGSLYYDLSGVAASQWGG